MTSSPPNAATAAPVPRIHWLARAASELSLQDRLLLLYFTGMWIAALQGSGPHRALSIQVTSILFAVLLLVLGAVRAGPGARGVVGPMTYRLVSMLIVPGMYLSFRFLLPTANPASLDPQLHRIDVLLFGVEPTLWIDRFITPARTEWFSFFYYSYFFFLAAHAVPLLFARLSRQMVFGLGILGVTCIGHLLYLAVPGYGPWRHLQGGFPHELPHGFWFDLVLKVVVESGGDKDIFPSLHTAQPMVIALLCFRHRREFPFRFTWPISAFFAINMMIATIYLRWHWMIDVVAGLTLALTGALVAPRLGRWELAERSRRGLGPAWPRLPWDRE